MRWRISWWGGVELVYFGDRAPDPDAYRPPAPTRPHWSDPIWSSAMPADFSIEAPDLIFPLFIEAGARAPSGLTASASSRAVYADTS